MFLPSVSEANKISDSLFFETLSKEWTPVDVEKELNQSLQGVDDGELFLEYRETETLGLEEGILRRSSFNRSCGFGLRAIKGEQTVFAHSDCLSLASLKRAGQTLSVLDRHENRKPNITEQPASLSAPLYSATHPLHDSQFAKRVSLLKEIDAYARSLDSRVVQVNATLFSEWQVIKILRPACLSLGQTTDLVDIRPLVRLDVTLVVKENNQQESGHYGQGGRYSLQRLSEPDMWQNMIKEALRQALVKLESVPAPAGEMPVILGAGWPGILLHEAVGHGLEGDFNRKKTSVFTDKIGHKVAAAGVTVIDDGTLPERRGSLTIDDEGTPTNRTVLIENGILKSYIHDRLNARLSGQKATGNGRRESYAHAPLPRMTNTLMAPGDADTDHMIRSTDRGLYAVNFGGGQVDITSGKFVFAASEAYLIENGRVTKPVKGATLIGSGAEVMQKIELIGSEVKLDPGIGTCGKSGQGVPVGVGQPMIKVAGLTIGGIAS
ncbi:metalloprotease TldD [Aristophania vespae]|uniref:Metalloprotease TldD n=1 Tax=Aristophania vespae TaxID=2697033 RepID=A0A6P1NFE0_9PROT|nr:metalloprotease TldD [Aristophania vespae]QHI96279.1 metalloprotease TldD [Aristophania vespae]